MGYIGNAPYQGVVDSGNILDGSIQTVDIANSAITSSKLAGEVTTLISQGGGPRITGIQVTNSSYTVLDDTAVDIAGGYIKITGTGFASGCQVLVNSIAAASTTFVSSTEVRAQLLPTTAGTYVVYLVNSDGGVAIRVNGVTFSAVPSWTTTSSLTSSTTVNIQLQASGASTFSLATGSTLPSGLTLSSSGLLSGTITGLTQDTTYSFTVNAIDAENQDSPRTFSLAVTITIPDPYFEYVTLLLSGQGTNLKQNNEFLDSSTANSGTGWPITRYGNTTQGTFSPFSQTGWGNYFNGSASALYTPNTGQFAPTGDFTIGFWVYPITLGVQVYVSNYVSNLSTDWSIETTASGTVDVYTNGATRRIQASAGTLTTGSWFYIALVRSSNTITLYVNGASKGTYAQSGTFGSATKSIYIGANTSLSAPSNSYISNVILIDGTATTTVPTAPSTAVSGTSLLTCQSNRFKDNANNFTLTATGSPTVVALDRKSTRLNSSHVSESRMPSSA